MVSLTIEMPEEALSSLRETTERFTAELRFAAAVQWYHQGRLSGSKAAQIAGMTRLEFLDELARRRLDVVKVDLDRLREEIGAAGATSVRKAHPQVAKAPVSRIGWKACPWGLR